MKVSRDWLQTYFDGELPAGPDLADVLMFHTFEVEGVETVGVDTVIDVDVLPNRSSDCLSHRGVARDLATLLSRPLKRDPLRDPLPKWERPVGLAVAVEDRTVCARYMAAVVRGVTVGPSPEWLRTRLAAIGQRSINNVVDATNYVMFSLGQPLHAFDLAKLAADDAGERAIVVRYAEDGEQITVLTGETYTLEDPQVVIADGVSGAPLAIAGIKGGTEAEIGPDTIDIVLEAANFDYVSVRKTSRALKLATDASLRFQNEPARQLPAFALREVVALIHKITEGVLVGVEDVYTEAPEHAPISVALDDVNRLLGTRLTLEDVEAILVRFEWEFSRSGDTFAVTPPWERTDIIRKEDLIEEIGRVYGYEHIDGVLPPAPAIPATVHKSQYYADKVRATLVARGYAEVYTYTLREVGEVELVNPLAADKAFMRRDLAAGVSDALELNARNAAYLGFDTVKLFEVGTVFHTAGEVLHVALGARAVRGTQARADAGLAEDRDALADALGVAVDARVVDGVVEFSLDSVLPELPTVEHYAPAFSWDAEARYRPWSSYPVVLRDIAVWAPRDTPAEEVLAVIIEIAPELLVRHHLFDTYEKGGQVSYAWHLVFRASDRTLTDDDVTPIMDAVATAIGVRGWTVR